MNKPIITQAAIIIGMAVLAAVGIYFLLNSGILLPSLPENSPSLPPLNSAPPPVVVPIPNEHKTNSKNEPKQGERTVMLGEEFTLKKDESIRIEGTNTVLKVKDFIYSPCPEGSQCIWGGLAVVYELVVDGTIYDAPAGALPPGAPYAVSIQDTDYQTHANFVIQKQ
ncbi:MAG: hypothetical protein A2934_04620 [Candidatus Sungbacteria bacterium RIFCSPLOWO2_01_FULL_47_10]|uniref:Uncharacterized protein n=1 Tax=Candidatus Sungbacteria bacterium RIFCSPLOWO2_01_FULL_47_10 TaxID=1802276 RepID=A0A1G2L4M9_9BACT|nr:MAG: hypothetical protein A2934_04620 [Candidatus Sungbacteria bacterium RIFCSPLOWO2_01_FULL_47_10]